MKFVTYLALIRAVHGEIALDANCGDINAGEGDDAYAVRKTKCDTKLVCAEAIVEKTYVEPGGTGNEAGTEWLVTSTSYNKCIPYY